MRSTALLAEAERNRTSQTEVLGLNGFEDRAAHQDGYASSTCTLTLSALLMLSTTSPRRPNGRCDQGLRGLADLEPTRTSRMFVVPGVRPPQSAEAQDLHLQP